MTSVELHPSPLPSLPPTHDTWQKYWPQYLSAYNLALNAETYATQQAEADPAQNDNITSARVAGYLLLEFFHLRDILTTGACEQISKELHLENQEPGGSVNDVVFKIGKFYRDRFIRLCMFHFLHTSFDLIFLQSGGQQPRITPHPHCIRLPLPSTRWMR